MQRSDESLIRPHSSCLMIPTGRHSLPICQHKHTLFLHLRITPRLPLLGHSSPWSPNLLVTTSLQLLTPRSTQYQCLGTPLTCPPSAYSHITFPLPRTSTPSFLICSHRSNHPLLPPCPPPFLPSSFRDGQQTTFRSTHSYSICLPYLPKSSTLSPLS